MKPTFTLLGVILMAWSASAQTTPTPTQAWKGKFEQLGETLPTDRKSVV